MDNTEIQCLVLNNGTILISSISAIVSELGEPDCKLINPCQLSEGILSLWLSNLTDKTDSIMISSDKILTLIDPKQTLLNDYLEFIK